MLCVTRAKAKTATLSAERVLMPHRTDDIGHTLWLVHHRVQEALIKGGVKDRGTDTAPTISNSHVSHFAILAIHRNPFHSKPVTRSFRCVRPSGHVDGLELAEVSIREIAKTPYVYCNFNEIDLCGRIS